MEVVTKETETQETLFPQDKAFWECVSDARFAVKSGPFMSACERELFWRLVKESRRFRDLLPELVGPYLWGYKWGWRDRGMYGEDYGRGYWAGYQAGWDRE